MPSSSKLFAMAGAFFALLGISAYLWFHGHPSSTNQNPLQKVDASKINRMVMQGPPGAVAIEKKNGKWEVTSPFSDVVDPTIPVDMLATLRQLTIGSRVSENPQKYGQFGLDKGQASHLQVFVDGDNKPVLDVYLGKNANNYLSCYFRFEASTPVYIANNFAEYEFKREPRGFRLMKILPVSPGDLTALSIVQEKSRFELVRSSNTWMHKTTGKTVDTNAVAPLLNKLENLNASDFGTGQETPDALGFDHPTLTITLQASAGSSTVVIGKKVPLPFPKAPEMRYARTQGRSAILIVRGDTVKDLLSVLKTIP